MLSLDDLTTPLTRTEAETSLYDVLDGVGANTSSWKPGAWPRTVITGAAILVAACSRLTAGVARGGFLETAEKAWLTLKARYDYNVLREEATFAEGEVTLVNASGALYELEPGDLRVYNPETEKAYRNSSDITLNPMGTVTVAIVAVEAGSASTSPPGTITELETTLLGVTCTNALAVVGRDEESDPVLKTRCAEKLGSLSPNGPWDAYAYAARNAKRTDGSSVGVTRVRPTKDGYGNVTLYVATATGPVTGDADDPETDLGAVNEAVQRLAAPLAVTAHVVSATAVAIAPTYALWIYNTTGLDNDEIKAAVAARLTALMAAEPISGNVIDVDAGKVYASAISAAIGSTRQPADSPSALPIFRVVLTVPAGDTTLGEGDVPVLGTITATVNQVTPAEGGF